MSKQKYNHRTIQPTYPTNYNKNTHKHDLQLQGIAKEASSFMLRLRSFLSNWTANIIIVLTVYVLLGMTTFPELLES